MEKRIFSPIGPVIGGGSSPLRGRLRLVSGLLFMLLVAASGAAASDDGFDAHGKLQAEIGADDNSSRGYDDREIDSLNRLLFSLDAGYRFTDYGRIGLDLLIGGEKYIRNEKYDRSLAAGRIYWSRQGDWIVNVAVSIRAVENLSRVWRNYYKLGARIEGGYRFDTGTKLIGLVGADDLNTELGEPLDYVNQYYGLRISQTITAGVFIGADYLLQRREHYSHARINTPKGTALSEKLRKDTGNRATIFAGGGTDFLWRAEYSYSDWESNSYGASYESHSLSSALGGRPTEKLTILFSAAITAKKWKSHTAEIIDYENARNTLVEEQDETLNKFGLRITEEIYPEFEAIINISRSSNEFSDGPYYRRDVLMIGAAYRF